MRKDETSSTKAIYCLHTKLKRKQKTLKKITNKAIEMRILASVLQLICNFNYSKENKYFNVNHQCFSQPYFDDWWVYNVNFNVNHQCSNNSQLKFFKIWDLSFNFTKSNWKHHKFILSSLREISTVNLKQMNMVAVMPNYITRSL